MKLNNCICGEQPIYYNDCTTNCSIMIYTCKKCGIEVRYHSNDSSRYDDLCKKWNDKIRDLKAEYELKNWVLEFGNTTPLYYMGKVVGDILSNDLYINNLILERYYDTTQNN